MADLASKTIRTAHQSSTRDKTAANSRSKRHHNNIVNAPSRPHRPFGNCGTGCVIVNCDIALQYLSQLRSDRKIRNTNQIRSSPQNPFTSHETWHPNTNRFNIAEFAHNFNQCADHVVGALRRISANFADNAAILPNDTQTFCSTDINSGETSIVSWHSAVFSEWTQLEPSTL
jgi:hypothetical protein